MSTKISHEELISLLCYDRETGVFSHRNAGGRWGEIPAGTTVGGLDDMGYVRITIGRGRRYRAHRLAWFYVTGEWPIGDIDHIDGNRSNNCFANLRAVSRQVNLQNRKKRNPLNTKSGLIGAVWSEAAKRWTSRIRAGGKLVYLGLFDTPEEAHNAYVAAKRRLHEGNTL